MPYCYCTPSRDLYWGQYGSQVWGTKGYRVSRSRSEGAIRGWQTRRRNLEAKAQWDRERAEAAAATKAAEPVVFVPFIIDTPTPAPEAVAVNDPVAITLEVGD
jgi:hypothetical protein